MTPVFCHFSSGWNINAANIQGCFGWKQNRYGHSSVKNLRYSNRFFIDPVKRIEIILLVCSFEIYLFPSISFIRDARWTKSWHYKNTFWLMNPRYYPGIVPYQFSQITKYALEEYKSIIDISRRMFKR